MKRLLVVLSIAGILSAPAGLGAEDWKSLIETAEKGDALDQIYTAEKYAKQPDAKKAGYGKEAAKWYERAAKQGCVPAMMALAQLCDAGKIIDRNENRAVEWYQKAAGLGETRAFIALGDIFTKNRKNPGEGAKWYKKAAERGDPATEALYGDICLEGRGVAADAGEAKKWYQKAADKGHPTAMIALGKLYEEGKIGETPDLVRAYVWYDLGWRYGQQSFVQEFKERVGRALSQEQFSEANRLANDTALEIDKRKGSGGKEVSHSR